MTRMTLRLWRTVFALLLITLPACGGKATSVKKQDTAGMVDRLPFPDVRTASDLTEYVLSGAAAEQRSAGAVDQGTALVLSAELDGFEYALYRFNPAGSGAGTPDSVSVLLEEGPTTAAWIGRADYSAERWVFAGPFTQPKTLLLDDPKYVSPDGNVWVAVLVAAQQSATVSALSVRTINPANQPPLAALSADPLTGNAPLTVQFDASGSSDSEGEIIEYAWDFDGDDRYDGFSDGPTTSFTYDTAGLRTVRVRVTDDQFARATATVEIDVNVVDNAAPVADFTRTPVAGDVPLSVDFDGSSSTDADGVIVRYDWDFDGDGTWDAYDSGAEVSHTYTSPGAFVPLLRVTDNAGAQALKSRTVNATVLGNDSPLAALDANPETGDAPLTVNLDGSGSSDSDGSIVRYDWDFDGDGIWDAYDAPNQVSHTYLTYGSYTAGLRVTDDAGAQATATAMVAVNAPPMAQLHTDTPKVNKGETVFLDAADSSDSDGSVADYEWDLDGDGTFNEAGAEADAQGEATAAVLMGDTPGELLAQVRVTDDDDAQDTASMLLTVRGWLTLAVDTEGNVGGDTSLGLIAGRPAISYVHNDDNDLRYVLAGDDKGSVWNVPVVVDSEGNVGTFTSLEVVNGAPAISYYDFGNEDLKYAYSTTADGGDQADWTTTVVDTAGDVGKWNSLAVINGKPAISYYDDGSTTDDLKYAYSSTEDGSSDWTAITLDSTGNVGNFYSSLIVVNGKPAIAYFDNTNNDLKYAYSSTLDGADAADWTALVVDSVDNTGSNPSLALVDGRPAISYRNFTSIDLMYAYSSMPDGSSGWTTLTVDAALGSSGANNSSLTVVNGRPATSYYGNGTLKYAYSSTVDGSADWTTIAVDTNGTVGRFSSQVVLTNGNPGISYFDDTNDDLKYAVLFE